MSKRSLVASLVATVVVVAAAIGYLASGARPELGLDLRGGISAIYSPVLPEGQAPPEDLDRVLDQTISVIRARVDRLGVAEPSISRQGSDVLVQLPGVEDADRARELIGTTAKLTFRPVEEVLVPGTPDHDEAPACDPEAGAQLPDDQGGLVCGPEDDPAALAATGEDGETRPVKYRLGPAAVTGDAVEDAFPGFNQNGTGYQVNLEFDDQGAAAFADVTGQLACERDQGEPGLLAIVLDGVVETAPSMTATVACDVGIAGGQASITTGGTTLEESQVEADDLALVLQTGALPITLEPSTFETVSPTLGADSLRAGLLAGLIGFALVCAYLVFFYRWLGLVATGALLIFGVLTLAIVTLLGEVGFALTLAGVAGVIVSIGITADSSVLFYERIRDEVGVGKTMRTAVRSSFRAAFRTNLSGNTVTLIAAVLLYFLAVGPVRGFALTLGLSTLLDLLILYFYSRPTVGLLGRTRALSRRSVRAATPEPATVTAGAAR